MPAQTGRHVLCVDFGSTFTKAALVDLGECRLVGAAEHPTVLDGEILDGLEACRDALGPAAVDAEILACSSAGGGLRIAVVGNEELVTAEAGRRVALTSGGRVVHVSSGGLDEESVGALGAASPDVVLLLGGTDGGNSEVLLLSARTLAGVRWSGPVVVAGNVDAQDQVADLLARAGTPHVVTGNVVPRIGVLEPTGARAAIRDMFLTHVIGGKHLSADPDFGRMVVGATPDVVLTAVELLAELVGDVVVVDVGGATTDVYSVVEVDPEEGLVEGGLSRDVVAVTPANRSVEGDLGVRWSAPSTVEAAERDGGTVDDDLRAAARTRRRVPAYLPESAEDAAVDERLAALAAGLAVRRHAGSARVRGEAGGRIVERSGVDLREVRLVVGSGGALRHATAPERLLAEQLGGRPGWLVPEDPTVVVDADYVLAPAGLLAADHPEVARALLHRLVAPARRGPAT